MGCKEINLTMDDSGKTITVSPGEIINIELVSNRSTGNKWQDVTYNHKIIKQGGSPVYKKDESGKMGAPGKVSYVFEALQKGETTLDMEYKSVHDRKKAPVRKFGVTIIVE